MKIVAAYSFRYEPYWMVEDLRENLSWVDYFAEHDDRGRDVPWAHDDDRMRVLNKLAAGTGADFMLYVCPDERFEVGAEGVIRRAIRDNHRAPFSVALRELWTPDSYRVDGVWGRKRRRRLYPIERGRVRSRGIGAEHRRTIDLDVNLYHQKMIDPENRVTRKDVFNRYVYWQNQDIGFDYLTDEEGIVLEAIPEGRGYFPAYRPFLMPSV